MGMTVYPDPRPRGLIATQACGDAPSGGVYIGDTETTLYTVQFVAAPARVYRAAFRIASIDSDAVGTNTYSGIKNAGITWLRWASGSTVDASGTLLSQILTPVFTGDAALSAGVSVDAYIQNPPAGLITVGVSLSAAKPAATNGSVRYLDYDASGALVVEDVGPAT